MLVLRMPRLSKPRRQKRELCFLNWLQQVLDQKLSPNNAFWVDKNAQIFAVRWVHAKSPLWSKDCVELFQMWKTDSQRTWRNATGEIDKHMKTNFRMNLRSDCFVELTDTYEDRKLKYPFRVFQIVKTRVAPSEKEGGDNDLLKVTPEPLSKLPKKFLEKDNREFYPVAQDPMGSWPQSYDIEHTVPYVDFIPDILPSHQNNTEILPWRPDNLELPQFNTEDYEISPGNSAWIGKPTLDADSNIELSPSSPRNIDNCCPGKDLTLWEWECCASKDASSEPFHSPACIDQESLGPRTPTLLPIPPYGGVTDQFISTTSKSSFFSFEAGDQFDLSLDCFFDKMPLPRF